MLQRIPLDLKFRHQKKLVESREERPSKVDPVPFDVEVEILTKLPVKSLMRSRCVSKMWSSVIRSQGFVDAYYAMSSATRSRFLVAFSNSVFVKGDAQRLFIFSSSHQHQEEGECSSLVANLDMTVPSLSLSYVSTCPSIHGFVGCCYGLQFTICNPSTRQVITLPCKGNRTALGYDPVNAQFKVLSLVPTRHHQGHVICSVYEVIRLGGGESRSEVITSPPYCPLTNRLCINGFIYCGAWAPRPRTNPVVLCFDVTHEKISFITTPKDFLSYSVLIEYKGKLAFLVRHDSFSFRSFDLWILEDVKMHGWSKQTFELPYHLLNFTSPGTNKAGEIIFVPTKLSQPFYIFYYNIERKDLTRVRIHGIDDDEGFRHRYGLVHDCNVSVSPQHVESVAFL